MFLRIALIISKQQNVNITFSNSFFLSIKIANDIKVPLTLTFILTSIHWYNDADDLIY